MKITIDGIKYNLVEIVEQKVDQEREDAIVDMVNDIGWHDNSPVLGVCTDLYNAGYRKVGEAVSPDELQDFIINLSRPTYAAVILLQHFDITRKVVE